LLIGRDEELAGWDGLQPNTRYCFIIQPRNAYLILAPASLPACVTTVPIPAPTSTRTPTPTPTPCPPGGCPVGGVAGVPQAAAVATPVGGLRDSSRNAGDGHTALYAVAALAGLALTAAAAFRLRRR
jgi:hypothetical protein